MCALSWPDRFSIVLLYVAFTTIYRAVCLLSPTRGRISCLTEFEPNDVEMQMATNGEVVSTGNGAAWLGDPL